MRFVLKKGATGMPLALSAHQANGLPLNLTGCTVTFTMKDRDGGLKVNAQPCDISDPPTLGLFEYPWIANDLDTPGTYYGTFRIVLVSGKPLVLPNEDTIEIVVEAP